MKYFNFLVAAMVSGALSSVSCGAAGDDGSVLVSRFAGTWYPGEKKALEAMLDKFGQDAAPPKLDGVIALIMPHAGYEFSGRVAMWGAKAIAGRAYDRVVVIGPSHRFPLTNLVSIPNVSKYRTPFGDLDVDFDFVKRLRKSKYVVDIPKVHAFEHSVQMELPLLQYALENPKIVPIVCGQLDRATTKAVAALILKNISSKTLVVVSSDFTHYGLDYGYVPFRSDVEANLEKLDMGAFREIEALSADGLRNYIEKTGDTICGRSPIEILLRMIPRDTKTRLLARDTSGRITGDFTNSVSYLCVALTGKWGASVGKADVPTADEGGDAVSAKTPAPEKAEKNKEVKMNGKEKRGALSGLADSDRKALLSLARKVIRFVLDKRRIPTAEDLKFSPSKAMGKEMGAFVTIKEGGCLRGCIGEILPCRAVWKAVLAEAVNAAFNDPRFPPLSSVEFDKIDIEISVLTPPVPVASRKDIVIGKHGVILTKDGHSAVFLPQVATEQGWGLEETLSHLSLKAGLPEDAWKSNAKFEVFQADVFAERE